MKAPQDCTGVNLKLEAKKSKKKKKGKNGEEGGEDESIHGDESAGSLKRSSTGSSAAPSISTSIATTPTSPRPGGNRQTSMKHLVGAPAPDRLISSPATSTATTNGGAAQKAKVLYAYDATSPQELSVKPNDILTVIEPDDGSGWVMARVGRDEGLVPAAYVEIQSADAPRKGPPVAPRRGAKKTEEAKKKYFRALYDYDAGSELELSIREGDVFALVAEDKGDGWTEVEMKGKQGSVPSNYIAAVTAP